jgi:3-hydroxyacyl-CoA dehydrogenase
LEIIIPRGIQEHTLEMALKIAKRLDKIIVYSEDIAGFIGNGHFISEISEACSRVEKLRAKMTLAEAICTVNTVTQDFLIRPMGLFQLADYVGLDVVSHIANVMSRYLPSKVFNTSLIDDMLQNGIKGGQNADGTQKEGFFCYEKGHPIKVYDLEKRQYVPYITLEEGRLFPKDHESWKAMSKDKFRKEKLSQYFTHLLEDSSMHAKLAVDFLEYSRAIAHGLVHDGVARSIKDVDIVLKNGFFHLYSVDDPWKEK